MAALAQHRFRGGHDLGGGDGADAVGPAFDVLDRAADGQGGTDGARAVLRGEDVELGPRAVLTLAMAFHELATNSAKYGALSKAGGQVAVTYAVTGEADKGQVVVQWRDSGGPPVTPPTRQGLGTTLIRQLDKSTFGGDVTLEYPRDGLVCRMTLPKAAVEAASLDPTSAENLSILAPSLDQAALLDGRFNEARK